MLEALEKNLTEYNKLRDQFMEIFEEIKQLNDPTTKFYRTRANVE